MLLVTTDPSFVVMAAIIAAVPGCLASVLGFMNNVLARRNEYKLVENSKHVREAREAITTLEHNTNSIKDALVKVTGEAEFQKGLKQGQGEQRDERP
jgi:hypothetical protein